MKKSAKKILSLLAALCLVLQLPLAARAELTDEEYQLINDMVFSYKLSGDGAKSEIRTMLAELKKSNRSLGSVWEKIMDYWAYSNGDFPLNEGGLPDDLPQDKSLAIVVLGFELKPDGSMSDELIDRCTLALRCAEQYPEAYIIVTGGGTARNNYEVTEADSMAEWLSENGVSEERIIIENKSLTTAENAMLTYDIINTQYPEIESIAIVTSDYHVPLGCMLFTEQLLLGAYTQGETPVRVISNAAVKTKNLLPAETIPQQAKDVWSIASILFE